jgi:hypothetical protein
VFFHLIQKEQIVLPAKEDALAVIALIKYMV